MEFFQMIKIIILFLGVFFYSNVFGATYYIDYTAGDDTRSAAQAQSKDTPWKHAPGMYGCTSNCAALTPAAGDNIILKGGETWPNDALPWIWSWSGTSTTASPGCTGSGCIYIGVDQTWYSGASWNRPILNAGGVTIPTRNGLTNVYLRPYANYVIFDGIEMTGLYWDKSNTTDMGPYEYVSSLYVFLPGGSPGWGTNSTYTNFYIHGWSHGSAEDGTPEHVCAVVADNSVPNANTNTVFKYSVIDGSDTSRDSCSGFFGGPPYLIGNYISYVTSAMVLGGPVKIDGNTVTNIVTSFQPTTHMNGIEINYSLDVQVSNNVISNLGTGTLGLWVASYPGYASTVFNNLVYNTDVGNVIDVAPPLYNSTYCTRNESFPIYCIDAGTSIFYNNTIEGGKDSNPNVIGIENISTASAGVTIKNNHFITSATTPNGGVWSLALGGETPVTASNNLVQSKATANGQGYSIGQTYPFSPTDSGDGTVNSGADLSTACSSFPDICNSSGIGVSYNAITHTVSYPLLAKIARGDTWDIGAYEYDLDETAPTASSYAINAAGSSFTVTFSEAVTHGAGGRTGWVLTSDGGAVTATYSSGEGSTALVYQLSRTVYSTETVTGTYTQPGNGIEDTAGNDFASVTDVAITNNSTATSGAPTYPKMTLSTGSNVTLSPSGTGSFTLAP